jgi:citrate synthase
MYIEKDDSIEETEISYQHPWLGRVYYRGIPLEDIIEEDLSLIQTAYLLITGDIQGHREIREKIENREEPEAQLIWGVLDIASNIVNKEFIDMYIISGKNTQNREIQNTMIVYLDNERDIGVYRLIDSTMSGADPIETISGLKNYYQPKFRREIHIPYRTIIEREDDSSEVLETYRKFLGEYRKHYLETLKMIVYRSNILNKVGEKMDRIRRIEKKVREIYGKYINIDLYTPLIFETKEIIDHMDRALYISRALGLIAYAMESKQYRDIPRELLYKGPIGIPLERYLPREEPPKQDEK